MSGEEQPFGVGWVEHFGPQVGGKVTEKNEMPWNRRNL